MSETSEENFSRRGFLKAVAATAAAATATGVGAGYLLDRQRQQEVNITSSLANPLPQSFQPVVDAGANQSELLAQLARVQAENVRLTSELEAAQRRLDDLQQASSNDALVETLQMQLKEANTRISLLAGLVALYEQLENIDVAGILEGGITTVNRVLSNLLQKIPGVAEGLAVGGLAISQFEAQIPLVNNGRTWLETRISRIIVAYQQVESSLQRAVETAGSFLQMLNEWFQSILRWLPFGMGAKAADVMEALTDFLADTPDTVTGLQAHVIQPLDSWLKPEQGEMPLQRNLIRPLREKTIEPTQEILAKTETVETVYQEELATPARIALDRRRVMRELIAEYRQRHQI